MAESSKEERFVRVAENRTNRIIKDLRLLGNCSNKSNYEYSEKDVKKIFDAIEAQMKETKARFKLQEEAKKFKL